MAFRPKISACFKNACKNLRITDTTGVYNVTTNPEGWEDVATVLGSEVQSATIEITLPNESVETFDVTSQIPATVTGEFTFTDLLASALPSGETWPDGEYIVKYIIVTIPGANNPGTYTGQLCFYNICNITCEVDELQADTAKKLCGCNCDADAALKITQLAEGLLSAIQSAALCNNADLADALLSKLTRVTTFNECNCN